MMIFIARNKICHFSPSQNRSLLWITVYTDGIQTHLVIVVLQVQTVWELNWLSFPFRWSSSDHQRVPILLDTQATSLSRSAKNHLLRMQVGQPSESDENGQKNSERESLHLETGNFDLCEVPTFLHYNCALRYISAIALIFTFIGLKEYLKLCKSANHERE